MNQTHKCQVCGEDKPVEKFHIENGRIRRNTCMACLGKRDRAKLKLDMIRAFGGRCQCCGEDHPYFLTLDHVKNDGSLHRKTGVNEQQIYRQARQEGWPKEKYQLLCMNCNFAKGHFGECPHKLGISSTDALAALEKFNFLIERKYGPISESQKAGLALGPKSASPLRTIANIVGKKDLTVADIVRIMNNIPKRD